MSRSRKKCPFGGIAVCRSEKEDKRIMNRILRHKANNLLKGRDLEKLEDYIEPNKNEVMDVWSMGKDGKFRFDKTDFDYYKKMMRK